jgi:type VI secretion system protein ImpM
MAGFYGKLPAKGDFLARNLPRHFIDCWDDWLQSGMQDSRQALGEAWLQIYLTSPLWRYALPAGVCGTSAWAGVLMPSMDKIGRYFPITVAVPLSEPVSALMIASNGQSWFEAVESCLLEALDNESLDLDTFDEQLQTLLIDDNPHNPIDFAGPLEQGIRASLDDDLDIPKAVLDLAACTLHESMDHCSAWWGRGSERVSPSLVLCRGLPGPGKFTAMLDGNWNAHGWCDYGLGLARNSSIVTVTAAD